MKLDGRSNILHFECEEMVEGGIGLVSAELPGSHKLAEGRDSFVAPEDRSEEIDSAFQPPVHLSGRPL
jgi:hypothetical protein